MSWHYAPFFFGTESGIFVRFRSLGWRRWRLFIREEMACHCRWEEVTRVEGAQDDNGGRLYSHTYYLFVYACGKVIEARADDDGVEQFAVLRDALIHYLPGFSSTWQQQLDSFFTQNPYPQNRAKVVLYERS